MRIPPGGRRFVVIVDSDEAAPSEMPVPLRPLPGAGNWYARPDTPFVLDPNGEFDVALNSFWTHSAAAVRAKGATLRLYARAVAVFCDFLWYARSRPGEPRTWRDATSEDRAAYHYWRNEDADGPRIAASTWNGEVVAVDSFYQFQVAVGNLNASPIQPRRRSVADSNGARRIVLGAAEKRLEKKPTAPWLSPRQYQSFRQAGLRGYTASGLRDPNFRGTSTARNSAFADLMFGTGLRLSEQSSLLVRELPTLERTAVYSKLHVSASVAKNESERFVLAAQSVLRAIATYCEVERSDAIGHARSSGAYDLIANKIVVDSRDESFLNRHGRRVRQVDASVDERLRLFVRGVDGLEPAMLWLTESGLPMRDRTWQGIFAAANRRCARLGVPVSCHPHKLRHSWATITCAQLQRRYQRLREAPDAGRSFIGDPIEWVSNRLGHRSIETTMIYVHTLEELEAETILKLVPDSVEGVPAPLERDVQVDRLGLRIE